MARILVVDDDEQLRGVLKRMLERAGHDVELAAGVGAGLDALERSDIDVVLADVVMPGRSGIQLLNAVRDRTPRVPVIIMSGAASLETAAAAVRGKAFDYLIKPVLMGTLGRVVADAVREKAREVEFDRLREEDRRHREKLERVVEERTRELREREALSLLLLDSLPCVAFLLRPGTREVVASNRAGRELGAVPGATCHSTWQQRDAPCPWCLAPEVWADGGARHAVVETLGKSWDAHWVPLSPDLYLHYALDTTEQRMMEARLQEQQKLESIGMLAGGVAHEINNPISGIMGYAQLILDGVDPAETREFAGEIITEVERVAAIVKNLLTFARHEGRERGPARAGDIVQSALKLFCTIVRSDQITLGFDVPDSLPAVSCRSQQIQQVVLNLLTNARDALNDRYPGYDEDKVIKITVAAVVKKGKTWVRTTVEDHGGGIPVDLRERIFNPFFTTKRPGRGTGLGLSVSQRVVAEHGGELSVESEVGAFTRFHLDLPADNGW